MVVSLWGELSAYYGLGNYEGAISDFNQAIALNPNLADFYKNRGFAYRELGQNEQAIADFEKYLDLSPNAADREAVEALIEELKNK